MKNWNKILNIKKPVTYAEDFFASSVQEIEAERIKTYKSLLEERIKADKKILEENRKEQ